MNPFGLGRPRARLGFRSARSGGLERFIIGALAAIGAGTALSGCRPSPAGGPQVQRWIAAVPSDELVAAQLYRVECTQETNFDAAQLPAGLAVLDGTPLLGARERGLTLRGGEKPPRIRLGRRFKPGEVDSARLQVTGVRRGNVRLKWFVNDDPEPEGVLELSKVQGGGSLHDQFYFDLATHLPGDRDVELEIEPTTAAGEVVTLRELCVGRARLDPSRVAAASRVAWKVTRGNETRDALLQSPEIGLERRFLVDGKATLSVGFARLAGSSQGVRLLVSAPRAGQDPLVLLDRRLGAEELASGWVDLDIDLSPLAEPQAISESGVTREIRLNATSEPEADPGLVAVWSAPRVRRAVGSLDRPNIVLISLDTLRADHLSLYGYERPTSPRVEAWVRKHGATVFRQAVAPSGWTLPSHFALFTGLEAFRHPANYNTVAIDTSGFSFLAERLLEAGYRTQAFTGGGFVHPVYGLAKGFESFVYWASKERRADELESNLKLVGHWLDQREARSGGATEPFLLFLHTYEIHTPYTARQPYFGDFSRLPADRIVDFETDGDLLQRGFLGTSHSVMRTAPGGPGVVLPPELAALPADLYDSAIAYVDSLLEPLLERLATAPFGRNTIVVLFSDHGETLGERGQAGHANLALDNLLVPMIVHAPGVDGPREVPTQVRLIDLFPTLLEMAGLEVPAEIDGRSLAGLLAGGREPAGRPAFAYAASTNHGVSLLSPEGWKLDWRNSPWKPIAGDVIWSKREGYAERILPGGQDVPEADRMMREIQQAYASGSNGLSLRLENLTNEPLRVGVTSDLVDPSTVKNLRLDGVRLDWKSIGYLELDLEPKQNVALQFERPQRRDVELEVGASSLRCSAARGSTRIDANLAQLRQAERRFVEMVSCPSQAIAPPVPALAVEVRWQGALPSSRAMPSDEALREDLAALGYIH